MNAGSFLEHHLTGDSVITDGIPYLPKGGYMHPNEIRITKENQERLIEEAQKLGQQYVVALMEQIERQGEKTK